MHERFECPKCKTAFYKEADPNAIGFNYSTGFSAYASICPNCMELAFGPDLLGTVARNVKKNKVVV
jgi:hypothetical protein